MAYPVTTSLDISIANTVVPPAVAVCFGSRWNNLHHLPLQAMFDQVVDDQETVDYLRYWDHKIFKYNNASVESLYNLVEIKRFVKLQFVCFSIKRKIKGTIDYLDLTDNFERPRFYTICFKPLMKPKANLAREFHFFFMYSNSSDLNGPSTTFAETAFEFTSVTLGLKKFLYNLLPPLYSTRCYDYTTIPGIASKGHCFEECMLNKMNPHKMYPFDVVIDPERHNLSWKRFVPPDYPKQLEFMNLTQKYRIDCRKECSHDDCHGILFVPIVLSVSKTELLTIHLYVSNEPHIRINVQSTLALVDFTTYILSCVGFWYAWSPLCLIPSKEGDGRKKSKNTKRGIFVMAKPSVPKSKVLQVPRQNSSKSLQTRENSNYDSYWTFQQIRPIHDTNCVCQLFSRIRKQISK